VADSTAEPFPVAKLDNPTGMLTRSTPFVKMHTAESGGVEPHPPLDGPKGYQAWLVTGPVHSPTRQRLRHRRCYSNIRTKNKHRMAQDSL